MNQQQVLSLAKQGDPETINLLVNQVLENQEISAKVVRKEQQLFILIEGDPVPDPRFCLPLIKNLIVGLSLNEIEAVKVYGRKLKQEQPQWLKSFSLQQQSTTTVVTNPKKPEPNSLNRSNSQPTKVKLAASPPQQQQYKQKPQQNPAILKSKSSRYPTKTLISLVGSFSFLLGSSWDFIQELPINNFAQFSLIANSNIVTETQVVQANQPVSPAPSNSNTNISTTLKIKAVGDIIPGTNYPNDKLPEDSKQLFQLVKGYLQGSDLVFGNFESTLTDYPYPAKDTSRSNVFAFRTPPSYAQLLKEVGFDVLSVANNHSMDFFETGFSDTIQNIEASGMKAVGNKNEITYLNVNNIPVAFIGFSTYDYHNSIHDLEAAKALVEEAKQNASIVVISIHAGAEGTDALRVKNETESFYGENRGNLVVFARTMIDAGADLILGHGPHVPRAIELYQGKLIAYSLGNFLGYRSLSTQAQLGYSLILEAEMDNEGNFLKGKIIPVHLNNQGIPYIDQYFRSVELMRYLTKGDFPDTPIVINRKGEILKQP